MRGFATFRSMIEWKALKEGKHVHIISRWQPTSKVCSECGCSTSFGLDVREWTCQDCGTHLDRDINAAKNIKSAGIVDLGLVIDPSPDQKLELKRKSYDDVHKFQVETGKVHDLECHEAVFMVVH
jgi:transposase